MFAYLNESYSYLQFYYWEIVTDTEDLQKPAIPPITYYKEAYGVQLQPIRYMNLLLLALALIIYPLFGITIYFIRNRLEKTENTPLLVLMPILLSFLLGIGILCYSILLI